MATVEACDGGCGRLEGEHKLKELGKIRIKRYCPLCYGAVLKVVQEIDELHTTLAKDWTETIKTVQEYEYVIAKHKEEVKGEEDTRHFAMRDRVICMVFQSEAEGRRWFEKPAAKDYELMTSEGTVLIGLRKEKA